jgi:hypothetical protein
MPAHALNARLEAPPMLTPPAREAKDDATSKTPTHAPAPDTAAAKAPAPAPTATAESDPAAAGSEHHPKPPKARNILFIIMDDVGLDEMKVFGWGKGSAQLPRLLPAPDLPNIDAIALSGVMFGNTWAMPECSPSRAAFFTGRYPMRTGVTSALIDNMFPSSQVSPYETTIPRVLETAGYTSALIGKFHLGIANPAGVCSPAALGWNYFNGYTGASPGAIDTTGGNGDLGAEEGKLVCGFDQSFQPGACYQPDGSCARTPTGKACLDSGGLFVARQLCRPSLPRNLDFSRNNSYYVWPNIIAKGPTPQDAGPSECPVEPVQVRQHQTPVQTDNALNWWNSQKGPRMLTLAYSTVHTPFQQPPGSPELDNLLACQAETPGTQQPFGQQWRIANSMLHSMDADIGRLLAGMGLATLDSSGVIETVVDKDGNRHIPELEASGTMVILIGDNGQFGPLVEKDFNPQRSKGTVYQTGVLVPLIVAGNLVQGKTGRIDNHMINSVDLFQFFGEIAGVDVNTSVAPAHVLDSKSILVHLSNPEHGETRAHNFTELGPGTFETPTNNATRSWPCVLAGTIETGTDGNKTIAGGVCSEVLFATRSFCEQENGGVWFGPPDDTDQRPLQFPNPDPNSYKQSWNSCCAVKAKLNPDGQPTVQLPVNQFAESDPFFKFVERNFPDCAKPLCPGPECETVFPPYQRVTVNEFYSIQPTTDNPAGMDNNNLACDPATGEDPIDCVPESLHSEYKSLQAALDKQLASEPACPGDGNEDKRVNDFDLTGMNQYLNGPPSIWDFNNHATTDQANLELVKANLGNDCIGLCRRADLNRDGVVDDKDQKLLDANLNKPCELCGSDLNGDGVVNQADVALMKKAIASCGRGWADPAASKLPVTAKK